MITLLRPFYDVFLRRFLRYFRQFKALFTIVISAWRHQTNSKEVILQRKTSKTVYSRVDADDETCRGYSLSRQENEDVQSVQN